ncbi:MAG: DEAD/DEAH box helicase, partial [Thermodesulfobacteriota bacterium]|nr:DEAD/DEAH box helicase [Thermodesulfobacteriota bacterium]
MPDTFEELGLTAPILQALKDTNYTTPFPIQAQSIPHLLDGDDLLGQAETGTGKTAAFGLPMLSHIDLERKGPQALVLTPTRELANQVTEALAKYARYLKGFRVLSVYGGQSYDFQLRELARGPHVVVGTPGRVMDHMKRGTLQLNRLSYLVLDEADKMLHMGFIDDVEWILKRMPMKRQMALFSATIPDPIRRVAQGYLNSPKEVKITRGATPAKTIRQRF